MNMAESHLNPIEHGSAPAGGNAANGQRPLAPLDAKIEVNDLNFYYGKFHALKNINLRISRRTR